MATLYTIHSVVRGRGNRALRASMPVHHRFAQYIGKDQKRLIRSRPLVITEEMLMRDLQELKEKAKMGILEVKTGDGRVLDLETMQPTGPVAVSPPLPNPPLDSAANDKPAGQNMPMFPGGLTQADIPVEFMPDPPAPVTDMPVMPSSEEAEPEVDVESAEKKHIWRRRKS